MGGQQTSKMQPPKPVDPTKAYVDALKYAETQRRLRESRGRKSGFLSLDDTAGGGRAPGSAPSLGY